MKPYRWLGWLGLGILVLLGGCARATPVSPEITIELVLTPNPPVVGPATAGITLRDSDDKPLVGATVELEATMTHTGMAPILVSAVESDPGFYSAPLEFTMAGDWVILIRAHPADGQTVERSFNISGVGNAP